MEIGEIDEVECLKEAGYTQEEIDKFMKDRIIEEDTVLNVDTGCKCLNKCINSLPKSLPEFKNISLVPMDKYIGFKLYKLNEVKIKSPRIFVPFGIDSYYKNWSINFELKNKNCEGIRLFKEYLMNFEDFLVDKLKITREELNTQFKIHNKYNMEFYGRIRNKFGKICCSIEDKRKESIERNVNIFNFPKEVYVKAELSTNGVWKVNNMYCYKYTVDKLIIVD
jgi:hypothetical protein